jgi:hypothetical protein
MKKQISIAAVFAAALFIQTAAAEITTEKEFVDAVRTAITEESVPKIDALTYQVGMSDTDKTMVAGSRKYLFKGGEIESVTLGPVPEHLKGPMVMSGKKIEPTCEPAGIIKIQYKKAPGGSTSSSSLAYGKVGGAFYLIGTKSTDLGWKGPPDKQIGYTLMGPGQNEASITVKYNASGVDLERKDAATSMAFFGQYISAIVIKSENPKADLKLTLREGAKEVGEAVSYKGAGEWTYERKK